MAPTTLGFIAQRPRWLSLECVVEEIVGAEIGFILRTPR
ncbi:Hypothetical protein A7982_05840 [Minicystis rosea]|nr:Hypothetical protein A7982_05840 [Minicystis rosea]